MRACQIQSAGACWLRASLRTAPSSRLSCGSLALTCLGITLLLPLRNTPTSYCSPFEEHSTKQYRDLGRVFGRSKGSRSAFSKSTHVFARCTPLTLDLN